MVNSHVSELRRTYRGVLPATHRRILQRLLQRADLGMENRQAVYDLLRCFLEKRGTPGIDCKKELPGLLDYGVARGCFIDPNEVFEREQWKLFREKIFDAVTRDDKVAKKMMKPWRAVSDALAQYEAEQKAAAAASQRLGVPQTREQDRGESSYPSPPSVTNFTMQAGKATFDPVSSLPVSPQASSVTAAPLEPRAVPTAPPLDQSPAAPRSRRCPQPPRSCRRLRACRQHFPFLLSMRIVCLAQN